MATQDNNSQATPSLADVLTILRAKGLKPIDWKHLSEAEIRKLAGV